MDINDKVTIVTGASAGIGLATARAFADAGAKVILAARSTDRLKALEKELKEQSREALALPTDMRDRKQVEKMIARTVERYGRLDVLINNAGQSAAGRVAEMTLENFRQILELNVFGVLFAIQAAVPEMRKTGGGLIINISSMTSRMHIPGLGAYAATKSALNLLSETAREELAGENIRVITVYPRMTATDFGKNALGDQRMRQQQRSGGSWKPVVDSPEFVAGKILEAARREPAEQTME